MPGGGGDEEGNVEVKRSTIAIAVAGALAFSSCAGMSDTQQRTLSGGAGGAAAGAIIGALAGDAGLGAAIGGAVGAGGGFLYGKVKESEQRAYDEGYEAGSR